jgi:hypothetical protein
MALLAHWTEARDAGWAATLLDWEDHERARRSLERRLQDASRIGRFKPLADFDWSWPTRCDRAAIDALMALDFLKDADNAVVVGLNGVGKSAIAPNIAHQPVMQGHTALFTSAGQLLGDLAAIDSALALRRRLSQDAAPALLFIDEVGYLSDSKGGPAFEIDAVEARQGGALRRRVRAHDQRQADAAASRAAPPRPAPGRKPLPADRGGRSCRTRPIFHSSDAAIRGHVFCSFLALANKKHLDDLARQAGLTPQWKDLLRDLGRLQEVRIRHRGADRLARTDASPAAARLFNTARVALPPSRPPGQAGARAPETPDKATRSPPA